MKYTEEHLARTLSYSIRLGIDPGLVHIPRTDPQADTLLEIQTMCQITYKADYTVAVANDVINPQREQDKALRDIDVLKKYLYDYCMPSELKMIAELTALAGRLDIDNRSIRPSMILDGAIAEIMEQLEDAKFSKTNIKENILPFFKAMIKDI